MDNKKGLYIFYIVFFFMLIVVTSFFSYYFYDFKNNSYNSSNISVSENNKIDYVVKYKETEYFDLKNESNIYLVDLIDKIKVNYSHSFNSSEVMDGTYKYYIVGKISNSNKSFESNIYEGKVTEREINGNVISISDNFEIDFNDVYNKYKDFIKNYKLDMNTSIKYSVFIEYDLKDSDTSYQDKKELFINIPINDNSTEIKTSTNGIKNYKIGKIIDEKNYICYIISGEFAGVSVIFALIIFLIVKKMMSNVSEYDKLLNNCLKKYSNKIIYLKNLPDLTKYNILFVKSFDDLLDASETVESPINFIEIIDHKESIFVVYDNNIAYIYKFSDILNKE